MMIPKVLKKWEGKTREELISQKGKKKLHDAYFDFIMHFPEDYEWCVFDTGQKIGRVMNNHLMWKVPLAALVKMSDRALEGFIARVKSEEKKVATAVIDGVYVKTGVV